MRGWGLLGLLVGSAWACSSEPREAPGGGGRYWRGLSEAARGTAYGAIAATPSEAGADSATAGATANDGGAAGASEGGGAGTPYDGVPCLNVSGLGQPATLAQLVGYWYYFPYSALDQEDTFDIEADGTGYMSTWLEGFHVGQSNTSRYSGTVEVTRDEIILHATRFEFDSSGQASQSEDVVKDFRYPFAYDTKSETLYLGVTECIDGKPCAYTHWSP
jgi:hypothetical protein